ncbi:protein C19orf12 homolog isoform X2 [Schistocerca americana]|uniref:protein C19orf12 homolog isoform X2 n=1 Tax=Schistocerca americana TaxID=7009 RepID=UPI001F4FDBF7|nr:protein C19orf12 homolog isoform X2 [Schistocerca americana]
MNKNIVINWFIACWFIFGKQYSSNSMWHGFDSSSSDFWRHIVPGSTFGGITAYFMSNNFKPLPQILMEDLSVHQKEELVRSVRAVINDIRVEDAVMLATLIVSNRTLSKTVLQLVVNFLRTQM